MSHGFDDESVIAEVWTVFKEYLDKKSVEAAAERFVDLLADYGVGDDTMAQAMGADFELDKAINYYLDMDESDVLDEVEDWG
jgi:hypothetical protein